MTCHEIMDKVYEYSGGEPVPLLLQIRIAIHLFMCPDCAREVERFEVTRDILRNGFFPPAPDFQEPVMSRVMREEFSPAADDELEENSEGFPLNAEGISFRRWVVIGLIVLVSLSTSFFGLDFSRLAASQGMSFLLPVGITVGVVLTGYGAFFIGSHLKELSERFGLH